MFLLPSLLFFSYLCTRKQPPKEDKEAEASQDVTESQYITDHITRRGSRCRHISFCGDPKYLSRPFCIIAIMFKQRKLLWFPMRIRNSSISRLQKLKELLDNDENVEATYVPMEFVRVKSDKMDFTPSLVNYIFVRSTFEKLKALKSEQEHFEPLRFVIHPAFDEKYERRNEVLYVPDKKMNDFMLVTAQANEKVIFLDNLEYACKPSQGVQITEGQFSGVVGRVKRIHGNKCVVIPIRDTAAVAILDLPRKHLRYLSDEEMEEMENASDEP